MNWSTTIVVKEPLHTLLTNVNKMEGGHRDRSFLMQSDFVYIKRSRKLRSNDNKTGINI